jgi:hypothetical protein
LLNALATLFLTIGDVRYLTAGGNERTAEEGKEALRLELLGTTFGGGGKIWEPASAQLRPRFN